MIIDLFKFKASFAKEKLEKNTLIVAEQMPGKVIYQDMSPRLENVKFPFRKPHYFEEKLLGFIQCAIFSRHESIDWF